MNQRDELSRVKSVIRALSAKTIENGCTEGEVNAVMVKIGELLQQYDLTMGEVLLNEEPMVEQEVELPTRNRDGFDGTYTAIANFTNTKVWLAGGGHHSRSNKRVHYFGIESDVMMAVYLTNLVRAAGATELNKFKETDAYINATTHRRRLTTSFVKGFTARVYSRLNKMKEERDQEMARAAQAQAEEMANHMVGATDEAKAEAVRIRVGTSLVAVKHDKVEEAFKQRGMRLRRSYNYSRVSNSGAYHSGHEAGGKVNLSRPVGGGSSKVSGYLR